MCYNYYFSKFLLDKDFSFHVSYKNSLFFIKGLSSFLIFKIPSVFFYKLKYEFLFFNRFFFFSFFKHFKNCYSGLLLFFFSRLKLRGLGFRIRKISKFLYRFFFNMTNYYYFFLPKYVFFKIRKKRILILSIILACWNWF